MTFVPVLAVLRLIIILVRNTEMLIEGETENQQEWAAALGLLEQDLERLSSYYQVDGFISIFKTITISIIVIVITVIPRRMRAGSGA